MHAGVSLGCQGKNAPISLSIDISIPIVVYVSINIDIMKFMILHFFFSIMLCYRNDCSLLEKTHDE